MQRGYVANSTVTTYRCCITCTRLPMCGEDKSDARARAFSENNLKGTSGFFRPEPEVTRPGPHLVSTTRLIPDPVVPP